MDEIRELLDGCFTRLQSLNIQPTLKNMEALVQTLYDLRAVYSKLEEQEHGKKDGGRTADPDGPDGD